MRIVRARVAGATDGAVTLASGRDTFTNAGDIDGSIKFTGASTTANTFRNSGEIAGNVNTAGSD